MRDEYKWSDDEVGDWKTRILDYINDAKSHLIEGFESNSVAPNNIVLTGGGEEMLRVAPDGFYVRGVKVKADKKEAKAVYEAFKSWMTYAILNGEIKN